MNAQRWPTDGKICTLPEFEQLSSLAGCMRGEITSAFGSPADACRPRDFWDKPHAPRDPKHCFGGHRGSRQMMSVNANPVLGRNSVAQAPCKLFHPM